MKCIAVLASLVWLLPVAHAAAATEPDVWSVPVAHEHALSWCLGYLHISADRIVYEVRQPDRDRHHSFEIARSEISAARQWTRLNQPLNAAELKFGSATYHFWVVTPDDVEKGRAYEFVPRNVQDAAPLVVALGDRHAFVTAIAAARAVVAASSAGPDRAAITAPPPTNEGAAAAPHVESATATASRPVGQAERGDTPGMLAGLFEGYTTYTVLGLGNMLTQRVESVFYSFWPNAQVYRGVPKGGLENFDFTRQRSIEPSRCGTYRIDGLQIMFAWADGSTENVSFVRRSATRIVLHGVDLDAVGVAEGLRLDGVYVATSRADFVKTDSRTAGGLTSERRIQFGADGKFVQRGVVAWQSPPARSVGAFGSAVRGDGAGVTHDGETGMYRITGNTLELTVSGRRQPVTFFVHPDHAKEARPRLIVLDGVVFRLQE